MARSGVTTPRVVGDETVGAPATGRLDGLGRPRVKLFLLAGVALGLVAIAALALYRETTTVARLASARPSIGPARPALTGAEETYARTLWPIHNEVKAGALRMTLGGLNYKLREIDGVNLRERVRVASEVYREAEVKIRALAPPPSLASVHAQYLEAVRLYQEAGREMARVLDDGQDAHLVTAFPKSQEAGTALLRVGQVLWPGEYLPN